MPVVPAPTTASHAAAERPSRSTCSPMSRTGKIIFHIPHHNRALWRSCILFFVAYALGSVINSCALGAESMPVGNPQSSVMMSANPKENGTVLPSRFKVQTYVVEGKQLFSTNSLNLMFAKYTGTNVSVEEIVQAAADLQMEYSKLGFPTTTVAVQLKHITNGVATLDIFPTPFSQVLISGQYYFASSSGSSVALVPLISDIALQSAGAATNTAATNAGPRFEVRAYEITGGTLLSTETLTSIFTKYTGTNVGVADIIKAGEELQLEYRDRGYPTVNVTIPPQQITNGLVKIRVFQGQLSNITVANNHYFSSNNIMRALPSLAPGIILNGPVFQAEVDRANANQDRQIYPQIEPGPEPNTTELVLKVKDQLPLHGKVELNNQNSPDTPDLRINTSVAYNNLWQYEHSLGVQYSFSPEREKTGDQWDFYDKPLIANYSAFYRMPLGNPDSVSDVVAGPGNFGYDEATRKFQLPAPSGRPELNMYASRSTIDTGVMTLFNGNIFNTNGTILDRKDVQQDLTVNENIGSRLSVPIRGTEKFQSGFSAGLDYKTYDLNSSKTNFFIVSNFVTNFSTTPPTVTKRVQTVVSPVPTTQKHLDYLPLALRYDASLKDSRGTTAFGIGLSWNIWFQGPGSPASTNTVGTNTVVTPAFNAVQRITGSREASGDWFIITPSLSRDFIFRTNWMLSLRIDGQWANEPLISNEQFGAGGVNSVRGYAEGEVFGDTGWHVSGDIKTPPVIVGNAYGNEKLTLRGFLYMDYAEVYLLDPKGRQDRTPLWGTGFGGAISVGPHWDARLLFSWPLEDTPTTRAFQPRFNFGLTGQF